MIPVSCSFKKHTLQFTFEAGTSRGVLKTKDTYFISISTSSTVGIGEASPLIGLSIETPDLVSFEDYEKKLANICKSIESIPEERLELHSFLDQLNISKYPSIYFGLEMALIDFYYGGKKLFYETPFSVQEAKIPINGLVWMGDKAFIQKQISDKIESGFQTIKMKIGAIDWPTELDLLKSIRKSFSKEKLTLRVDANGAFDSLTIWPVLDQLAQLDIHSIEQPIATNQHDLMKEICSKTPIPIALDEELIGIFDLEKKKELLQFIQPQYIILKPSLIGGFQASDEWIRIAETLSINWWMTSALESNIGLNAIAQYTASKNVTLPQGLGTGSLYHNNINSPLTISNGTIFYKRNKAWGEL